MPIYSGNEYFNVSVDEKGGRPQHIHGVVCDVRNCVYHDGDNFCTASRIAVGPTYATNSRDTVCATFRERSL